MLDDKYVLSDEQGRDLILFCLKREAEEAIANGKEVQDWVLACTGLDKKYPKEKKKEKKHGFAKFVAFVAVAAVAYFAATYFGLL